jgi:soluble lytic murein transglycosylase-like protein
MQATNCIAHYLFTYQAPTGTAAAPQLRAIPGLGLAAGILLLLAAAPEAGDLPGHALAPLEDNHTDLTLADIVERISSRLPAADKQKAYGIGRLVLELSDRHQFSPALILAVVEMESSYRFNVVSKAGAVGLMQLLPSTAREVALRYKIRSFRTEADLRDPSVNLRLGVAYLASLRRQFGNSLFYIAAYNLGPSALQKRIRAGRYDFGALEPYVRSIHERARLLRGARQGGKLPGMRREEALLAASS